GRRPPRFAANKALKTVCVETRREGLGRACRRGFDRVPLMYSHRAIGTAEGAAVQAAALGIALAREAAALLALVALVVARVDSHLPDQRLGLCAGAVLGVPAVAVLSAQQGVGVDRLRAAPAALR